MLCMGVVGWRTGFLNKSSLRTFSKMSGVGWRGRVEWGEPADQWPHGPLGTKQLSGLGS